MDENLFGGSTANLTTQSGLSGTQLKTDTLGGVYVFGYCKTAQAPDSLYWSSDTTLKVGSGLHMVYLVKYDTLGQFNWLRTSLLKAFPYPLGGYDWLSVSPSGQAYWLSLLDTGSYAGGGLIVSARNYYATSYNAAGTFQGATSMAMTPPNPWAANGGVRWEFDAVTNRFYGWLSLDTSYGPVIIGNTTINPPTAPAAKGIFAAFNGQGQNLWTKQSTGNNGVAKLTTGKDGSLYLLGVGQPGSVFCGDTAKNVLGPHQIEYLMTLDTNGGFRWSRYAATANYFTTAQSSAIAQTGNTVVVTGVYRGSLSWGTFSVSDNTQNY